MQAEPAPYQALLNTAKTNKQKVGVRVVLAKPSGEILLIQRSHLANQAQADAWELPGGGMSASETPEVAAARETLEETGLTVAPELLTYLPTAQPFFTTQAGEKRLQLFFVARAWSGRLKPFTQADEHQNAQWVHPSKLAGFTIVPSRQAGILAYAQQQATEETAQTPFTQKFMFPKWLFALKMAGRK